MARILVVWPIQWEWAAVSLLALPLPWPRSAIVRNEAAFSESLIRLGERPPSPYPSRRPPFLDSSVSF